MTSQLVTMSGSILSLSSLGTALSSGFVGARHGRLFYVCQIDVEMDLFSDNVGIFEIYPFP